jgi:hypothetical protein
LRAWLEGKAVSYVMAMPRSLEFRLGDLLAHRPDETGQLFPRRRRVPSGRLAPSSS